MYDLFIIRDEHMKIKNTSGIYVLLSDDEIPLYVGKSIHLRKRVKSHLISNGNVSLEIHTGKFYFIGIIYHEDVSTLESKETEMIRYLQPALNSAKTNYTSEINLSDINEYEMFVSPKCRYNISLFKTCGAFAQNDGYCTIHDPSNFRFSWIRPGKYITTEMQRLLYENEYKKYQLYFYMSKETFGKLLLEKNVCGN